MIVTAHVKETITVERQVGVEVPDGSDLDGEEVLEAIRQAAYEPLACPQGNPWDITDSEGLDVKILHEKCIRVEYDPNYWGGDYHSIGQFVCLPESVIDRQTYPTPEGPAEMDFDAQVRAAFFEVTGLDIRHIIHYCPDEPVDQYGNEWKEEWDEND